MKKYRKLKNGERAEELEISIKLIIKTKCPTKWIIEDLETGQKYRANGKTEIGKMFTLISWTMKDSKIRGFFVFGMMGKFLQFFEKINITSLKYIIILYCGIANSVIESTRSSWWEQNIAAKTPDDGGLRVSFDRQIDNPDYIYWKKHLENK